MRPIAYFMVQTSLLGQFHVVNDTVTVLRELKEGDLNSVLKGSKAGPVSSSSEELNHNTSRTG